VFLRGRLRIAAVAAVTAAAAITTGLALVLAYPSAPPARAVAAATLNPASGLPVPPSAPPDLPVPLRGIGVAACEHELSLSRDTHLLVVVGASFTAGVGPGTPDGSWAVVLARYLHWNAVVYGVPGAGYVRPGITRRGPVLAELSRIDLTSLNPSLIIVQAGHDDIRVNPALEQRQVTSTIALIHAEVPQAQIALVTVFQGRAKLANAWRTDWAIVSGATAADPNVIVMDPLAGKWAYQRSADDLHPTVAGSDWLAAKIGGLLSEYGVRPARAPAGAKPVLCDYSSVGKHTSTGLHPSTGLDPSAGLSLWGGLSFSPCLHPSGGQHSRILVPPPGGFSARTDPS